MPSTVTEVFCSLEHSQLWPMERMALLATESVGRPVSSTEPLAVRSSTATVTWRGVARVVSS